MVVESLSLENYRNYENAEIDFCPDVNVITGMNAQGKTNLIEAVYYLTCGRSFRAQSDRELIKFNSDFGSISADIFSQSRKQNIEVKLHRGRRKTITVNGGKIRNMSELSGKLTAVLFCPNDLFMIKSASVYRRRLMDGCISQLRPKYAAALNEFRRLYESKLRILKDGDRSMMSALYDFNMRMCEMSAVIIHYRASFVRLLEEKAKKIHLEFSGGEELGIHYKTVSYVTDPEKKPSELLPYLIRHQEDLLNAEIEARRCLSGAHKDDLEITLNGISAKSFGSQGQVRSAAISIKLAEREIHFSDSGEYPVLLLDDVLSELDSSRQEFILNSIDDGQVFITCCEDADISKKTGGNVIEVKGGEIRRV